MGFRPKLILNFLLITVVHARELIQYRAYNTGVLMTTYQETTAPFDDLLGLPIGLLEYYTMHPDGSGDLILLAMPISSVSYYCLT